jgi:hypothetical protein
MRLMRMGGGGEFFLSAEATSLDWKIPMFLCDLLMRNRGKNSGIGILKTAINNFFTNVSHIIYLCFS